MTHIPVTSTSSPVSQPPGSWQHALTLWPLVLIYRIWTGAVASENAVAFNLRLVAILTSLLSLPDLGQGIFLLAHAASTGATIYAGYVSLLAGLELLGGLLLVRRIPAGRLLILSAAAGFVPEMIVGLAAYDRTLIAVGVFALCTPAEAWVIWFLRHPRVRDQLSMWRSAA